MVIGGKGAQTFCYRHAERTVYIHVRYAWSPRYHGIRPSYYQTGIEAPELHDMSVGHSNGGNIFRHSSEHFRHYVGTVGMCGLCVAGNL